MILSVWRYSHLALAITCSLFLAIAAATGAFLSLEPVVDKIQNFKTPGFDTVTLAHAVPLLKDKYRGIQEITIDDNDFVLVRHSTTEGQDRKIYVDPVTGKEISTAKERNHAFQWATTLHRSLFLHETGRIVIGIVTFLLILIVVSGIFLIVKRQNGWKHFFSSVESTGFFQYYHVVFGRLCLFFILAIAVTGTYIAVYRYFPQPKAARLQIKEEQLVDEPSIPLNDFAVFQHTPLHQLKKVEYPFSDFPEDYFTIQLHDKEFCVNQFTGQILAEEVYSTAYKLGSLSMRIHTGRTGIVWSLILGVTSVYILFFIYSGFAITYKRSRESTGNEYAAEDARIIILVGSENGSTFKFAEAICKQLINSGEKVFLTDMSNYSSYPKAEQLIVMTSTYGQGEPPSNAKHFLKKISQIKQEQTIQYSVVGFGSKSYLQYCKFAYDVDDALKAQPFAFALLPVHTVNDKSPADFLAWLTHWSTQVKIPLSLPDNLLQPDKENMTSLRLVSKTLPDATGVFLMRFSGKKMSKLSSGDLLAIYPENDYKERLYSIGKIDNEIRLSIRLHENGLGSRFLNGLKEGDNIQAKLLKNTHFRFPKHAGSIIMISNGTGIAPFLGIIDENKKGIPIELYCGFRQQTSFDLYNSFLQEQIQKKKLQNIHLTLSREGTKEYVSDKVLKNGTDILHAIKDNGVIMICGSLSMQKDVLAILDVIFEHAGFASTTQLIDDRKILTDCY